MLTCPHTSPVPLRVTQTQRGAVPGGPSESAGHRDFSGFLLLPQVPWGKPGALQLALGTAFEVGHTWGQAWAPHCMPARGGSREGGLGALGPPSQLSLESAVTVRNVRLTCYNFIPVSVFLALSIALRHSSVWLEGPVESVCQSHPAVLPSALSFLHPYPSHLPTHSSFPPTIQPSLPLSVARPLS